MSTSTTPPRIASIDAYRGFVMFLMLAEVLHIAAVAAKFPESAFWDFLKFHTTHVEWVGCSLHDMIQPSFSFLVGVALPFSIASRIAKGQSFRLMAIHAAWRAFLLTMLGVFLRSVGQPQTRWTFEDTLSQIGLGYFFLFLLGFVSDRMKWLTLVLILLGYWSLFAFYPLAPADHPFADLGAKPKWAEKNLLGGFEAHWNINANPAWSFDTWFLNQFPREKPFTHNGGGYSTLSFIPTLATMLLGLIAGGWMRSPRSDWGKVKILAAVGIGLLALGWGIAALGWCPIVKKIWTPTWVLYSGGICFLMLAMFHATTDAIGRSTWAFPLQVIGANSIFAYCIAHLIDGFILASFRTHFGKDIFARIGGSDFEPLIAGFAVLLVFWIMLYWLYRQRIFIRI